jgi:PAS domain S-box-containing protein
MLHEMKAPAPDTQSNPPGSGPHTGLRFRLMVLSLLAMLPVFALVVFRAEEDRGRLQRELQDAAARLSESCASSVAQVLEGTRQTLITLAYSESMLRRDAEKASAYMGNVLDRSRLLGNLGLIAPDGTVIASGLPLKSNFNVSRKSWFAMIQSNRTFTIGEYQVGMTTGKPGIVLGLPLPGQPDGQPLSVVGAALNIDILQTCLALANPPADGVLNIIDRNGTILARNPNPQDWVGQSSKAWPVFRKAVTGGAPGFVETAGVDGTNRLYYFTEVPGSDRSLYVGGAISKSSLEKAAFSETCRAMTWLGIASLAALAAAWLAAGRWVLNPVRRLRQASTRLARGDLSARTRIGTGSQEFHQLARDLDSMAEALEHSLRIRRESEEKFEAVATSALDAIIMLDHEGRISFWNEAAHKMLGYSTQEAIGMDLHQCLAPPRFREAHQKAFGIFQKSGLGAAVGQTLELAALRKDGCEIPVELSVSAVLLNGRWNAVGIMRDITARKHAEAELQRYREHLEEMVRERTKELRNSEETARTLLNAIPASAILTDTEFTILAVNEIVVRRLGFDAATVVGNKLFSLVPEDIAARRRPFAEEALQTGALVHFEDERHGRIIDNYIAPIHDDEGRVRCLAIMGFDITELRQSEAKLKRLLEQREHANRALLHNISIRKQAEAEREQLIRDLQRALAEVKTLSGLLPICSACKKIRDDNGYWTRIESYLLDHSNAQFTHSLCPDCLQKYYPGVPSTMDDGLK